MNELNPSRRRHVAKLHRGLLPWSLSYEMFEKMESKKKKTVAAVLFTESQKLSRPTPTHSATAIDVVKPRRNQRNLQKSFVVESTARKASWSFRAAFVASFVSSHVIQHRASCR